MYTANLRFSDWQKVYFSVERSGIYMLLRGCQNVFLHEYWLYERKVSCRMNKQPIGDIYFNCKDHFMKIIVWNLELKISSYFFNIKIACPFLRFFIWKMLVVPLPPSMNMSTWVIAQPSHDQIWTRDHIWSCDGSLLIKSTISSEYTLSQYLQYLNWRVRRRYGISTSRNGYVHNSTKHVDIVELWMLKLHHNE